MPGATRSPETAPSPNHTADLAIPGEKKGVAAKLGERRFFKVAPPETARNHFFLFFFFSFFFILRRMGKNKA